MRENDYQFFTASCKSKNLDIEEYELRKALDTIAKLCKRTQCEECPISKRIRAGDKTEHYWCGLHLHAPQNYDKMEIRTNNANEVNDERQVL